MIVVTGGTGLVGAHLLLELLKQNQPVRVLIREGGSPEKVFDVWKYYLDNPEEYLQKLEWYPCDLENRASVYEAFQGATEVYHCAAVVSFESKRKSEMFSINVVGTRNIVDACLEQENVRLVYVSSIAAIGEALNENIISETDGWPVKPGSVYNQTKTFAELEVWRAMEEGLNAVMVNPSIILSVGNWQQSSARIIQTIARGLHFYTLGVNGFVDVRDVSKAMVLLMAQPVQGQRYILNGINISYKELFEKLAISLGVKPPSLKASPILTSLAWRVERVFSFFTGRPRTTNRANMRSAHAIHTYSSEKIGKDLGFQFTPLEDTLVHIASCYRSNK